MSYIHNGYRAAHIDGKSYFEHRIVWEKHKGKIPEGYIIHHINGDKLDNDISNLEMIKSNGEHIHTKHSSMIEYQSMELSESDLCFIKSRIAMDRMVFGFQMPRISNYAEQSKAPEQLWLFDLQISA